MTPSDCGRGRHDRRTFLRRLGLSVAGWAAVVPLLESFRVAADEPASVPQRLLVLFTPNGTMLDEFFVPSTDGALRLGRILEPLEPFRDDLLLWMAFDGL